MTDWDVLDSVVEYETGWYTGGYDLVAQPDGSEKRYYWAELPPAVIVVPIIESENVDNVAWHAPPFADAVAATFQNEEDAAVETLRRQAFGRVYRELL